jgi:hypothetical protein
MNFYQNEITVAYVELEVLTVVVMKSSIFWDIRPCSPLKLHGTDIVKDLEGSSNGLIEVLSWNLPGGAQENHKNLSKDSW